MIFPEWYLSILLSGYDFVLLYTIVIKNIIFFLKDFIVRLDYMLRILMFLCFHFLHFYILPFVIFFPLNSTSLFPLCYLHISLKHSSYRCSIHSFLHPRMHCQVYFMTFYHQYNRWILFRMIMQYCSKNHFCTLVMSAKKLLF